MGVMPTGIIVVVTTMGGGILLALSINLDFSQ
jgi:hypothetical protein